MTILEHTYRVELRGGRVVDAVGAIVADAGSAPHISGRLELPGTVDDADLDPRTGARGVITVDEPGSAPRRFDLGIRRRRAVLGDAGTELVLASDEAMLDDYAPTADDGYALKLFERTGAVDIGELVDGVLATVGLPGVAPFVAQFRTVTPYWGLNNYIVNARARFDGSGWTGLTNAGASAISRATGATGLPLGVGSIIVNKVTAAASSWTDTRHALVPVQAGETYTLSTYARIDLGGATTGSRELAAFLAWRGHNGAPLLDTVGARAVVTDTGTGATGWARVHVTAQAPVGATQVLPILRVFGAMPVNAEVASSCWMLTEGDMLVPFFDGGMPTTVAYRHVYTGAPDASPSRREPLLDGPEPDALIWRAGTSAMGFLHPLLRALGLRLVCDELRQWTLRAEDDTVPGVPLQLREGVNVVEADDLTNRDDWFDGRVTRYRWTDAAGIQRERVDAFTLPGAQRITELVVEAPYPGPGRSRAAVMRAQGRGRTTTVTAPAVWSLVAGQPVAIYLDGKAPQLGTVQRVEFDLETDRMTVTARVRDTAPGAIDLLPGTINALPGTINNL